MTSQLTYLIAQERIADRQREADQARAARAIANRRARSDDPRLFTRLTARVIAAVVASTV
jgi:hypothetical protein